MTTRSARAAHDLAGDPDLGHRAVSARVLPAVAFTFVCYLTMGTLLGVLPSHVHLRLGFGTLVAGLAVSAQYVATVFSRPLAGRMTDVRGPKHTVLRGLLAGAASGACTFAAAFLSAAPLLALGALLAGRLFLGVGESLASTGATMWGIRRVGTTHTARVISWNGVATYGGLAAGAPLGVFLDGQLGFWAVGAFVAALSLLGWAAARRVPAVEVVHGRAPAFGRIFGSVAPHGVGLALAGLGFGVIAAFVTLFYAQRGWSGAALALTLYGTCFVAVRLLFSEAIGRFGGYASALVSFAVEAGGLCVLGLAASRGQAFLGAALTGLGFSLVFPALAVEAVRHVDMEHRGTALGAYTVFVDVSLFVSGPAAGMLIATAGYRAAFLAAAGGVGAAFLLTVALAARERRAARA